MNSPQVISGLVLSILLATLGAFLIGLTPPTTRYRISSLGVLETLWLSKEGTKFANAREVLVELDDPTQEELRQVGLETLPGPGFSQEKLLGDTPTT